MPWTVSSGSVPGAAEQRGFQLLSSQLEASLLASRGSSEPHTSLLGLCARFRALAVAEAQAQAQAQASRGPRGGSGAPAAPAPAEPHQLLLALDAALKRLDEFRERSVTDKVMTEVGRRVEKINKACEEGLRQEMATTSADFEALKSSVMEQISC